MHVEPRRLTGGQTVDWSGMKGSHQPIMLICIHIIFFKNNRYELNGLAKDPSICPWIIIFLTFP
jgi:hypothetical protein